MTHIKISDSKGIIRTSILFLILRIPMLLFSQSRSAFGISSTVACSEGPESLFLNPSGLFSVRKGTFGMASYFPFEMKELAVHTAAAVFPIPKGGMGMAVESTGFSLYRENTILLACAAKLHGLPALGMGFRWTGIRIASYGSASTISMDAGMLIPIGRQMDWGFCITNLFPPAPGRSGSTSDQTTRAGIAFRPSGTIGCSLELVKNARGPWESKCLVEYSFSFALRIRFGFSRNPETFSLGVRLRPGRWILDCQSVFHPILGISYGVIWCFVFGGKKG